MAVALALANDPALILADEPTGNLDTANAAAIAKLLRPGDRLRQDGHHGQPRPRDRRALSDRVRDAGRPVCEGGLTAAPSFPKAQPPRV